MFEKWGFLLSEIWGLLILAALVGLLAGWLIWSRRKVEVTVDRSEADGLRAELTACRKKGEDLTGRISGLDADLAACRKRGEDLAGQIAGLEADLAACRAAKAAPAAAPAPLMAPAAPVEASRPAGLSAARAGGPDNLKLIKGVGPVLEELCNKLGYFHFDQIAAWTAAEVAWVDENLEGFKGRVTRDEWVRQARDLAAGKAPREGGEH